MATSRASTKKTNKSAWIRSQSAATPAKEIVAKAKNEGIQLSIAQVYTARSSAKKAKVAGGARGRRPGRPSASGAGRKDEQELRRLVLAIGINRAQEVFSALRREFGF